MREIIKWVVPIAIIYLVIRALVPLIPVPIDINNLVDIAYTLAFFIIALGLVGGYLLIFYKEILRRKH